MAVQFFGETGPIRVPSRSVPASETGEEPTVEPQDQDLPLLEKQPPIGKRLPQHRATTTDRVRSH